jgi:hypothetical protein
MAMVLFWEQGVPSSNLGTRQQNEAVRSNPDFPFYFLQVGCKWDFPNNAVQYLMELMF